MRRSERSAPLTDAAAPSSPLIVVGVRPDGHHSHSALTWPPTAPARPEPT
ncbi:hypothetical protein [Microbacterium aurantiacum]